MSDAVTQAGEPDMLAAELALGLLDGAERAAAMRRLLSDRAFAAEVERWRTDLAPLFDLAPVIDPPAPLWARIERSLEGAPAKAVAAPGRGWLWPSVAGLTSLAAAVLLAIVVTRPGMTPAPPAPQPAQTVTAPAPMLVAAIAPVEKGTPVTALYDPQSGAMRLTAASLTTGAHSQELWVVAADGAHSLGVLRESGTQMDVKAADRARLAAGAVLAVSIEPLGGSPTGQPTGPVVAKGALSPV